MLRLSKGHDRRVGWASAVVVVALLVSGCSAERAAVQRSGATSDTGYVGGDSAITQVAPIDRKPAPVVTGQRLGSRRALSTADYLGKVVVLNVWGSWCAPCRQEAPDLVKASKRTAGTAAFVGIDVRDYDPAPAEAFVRAFKVPYPSVYDPNGTQLVKFAGELPPAAIPTTLIVDKQGRIAARIVGVISEITLVNLIDDIAQGR